MSLKRTCIQCGKEFELSNSEIGFYKKRKLSLPKRCKECREQNKKTGNRPNTEKRVEKKAAAQTVYAESVNTHQENAAQKKPAKKKTRTLLGTIAVLAAAAVYAAVSGVLPIGTNTDDTDYVFRTEQLFEEHYEKHGIDMGFDSAEAYLEAANAVIDAEDALHKTEAEDGDDIYFLADTNEFVVVSTDGYIRTYYIADGGMEYYEKQ